MKKRISLMLFYALSFVVSVAPLVIVFIKNFHEYTKTVGGGVKLTVGGLIVVVLLLFKVVGKLRVPNGITASLVAFLISYLMQPLLADLVLFTGMYLLGSSLDFILIHPIIKKLRSDISVSKTAAATAKEVKSVFDEYMGRV